MQADRKLAPPRSLCPREKVHQPQPKQDAEPEQSCASEDEGAWPPMAKFHEESSNDGRFDCPDRECDDGAERKEGGRGERHCVSEAREQGELGGCGREGGRPDE